MKLSVCNTKTDSKGKELLEHGTALFPVSCYDDDLWSSPVPWHWHDEWEVLYVVDGEIILSVGTANYTVKTGEGIFINGGILHAAKPSEHPKSRLHSIVFHPRIVGGGIDSIYWQNYVTPILGNPLLGHVYLNRSSAWHQDAILNIQNAWNAYLDGKQGYELVIRTELSRLMLHLLQFHPSDTKRPSEKALRENERQKKMLLFIQQNYSNQINVSRIAEAAMISDSECMRCFRTTMGISPIKYVKQYRLQKAVDLLTTTNHKIIDIGFACGFQDVSYFIKSFKERYNLTPSEFQKEHD